VGDGDGSDGSGGRNPHVRVHHGLWPGSDLRRRTSALSIVRWTIFRIRRRCSLLPCDALGPIVRYPLYIIYTPFKRCVYIVDS
jgi:hypothetical protein